MTKQEAAIKKAYANKRKKEERPDGDFYPTPRSLIWVAKEVINQEFDVSQAIFEPCCGNGQISLELNRLGFKVVENDLYRGGYDYLKESCNYSQIITNPPFSLWDDFVEKSKKEAQKVMMIGRLNYFGTNSRLEKGLWQNLKHVYCFDRYVDYRTPERDDGLFHVGAMATAWFLWEKGFTGKPIIDFLSVQDYAKLGNIKI